MNRKNVVLLATVVVSMIATMSCSCPLLSLIAPAPTVTPTPTKTPRRSFTPTPTDTPTPAATDTPTETPTPAVTDTPTLTPVPPTPTLRPWTATPTRPPATPTPRPPTATPTPAFQYSLRSSIQYGPNCEKTELMGTVWDSDLATELAGVRLKVCVGGEYWCDVRTTPTAPGEGAGYYDFTLGYEGPRAASWWVAIVDAGEKELSERAHFQTDTGSCKSGGTGRQLAEIDFKKN